MKALNDRLNAASSASAWPSMTDSGDHGAQLSDGDTSSSKLSTPVVQTTSSHQQQTQPLVKPAEQPVTSSETNADTVNHVGSTNTNNPL